MRVYLVSQNGPIVLIFLADEEKKFPARFALKKYSLPGATATKLFYGVIHSVQ